MSSKNEAIAGRVKKISVEAIDQDWLWSIPRPQVWLPHVAIVLGRACQWYPRQCGGTCASTIIKPFRNVTMLPSSLTPTEVRSCTSTTLHMFPLSKHVLQKRPHVLWSCSSSVPTHVGNGQSLRIQMRRKH